MLRSFITIITVVVVIVVFTLLLPSLTSANDTIYSLSRKISNDILNKRTLLQPAYTPVNEPRRGESRFNANAFKVSHNAFEKPEEYYDQLDDYNVWGVELDVFWEDNQFEVHHDTCHLIDARNMNEHIAIIAQSTTWSKKLIVIWLEIKVRSPVWPLEADCPLPFEPKIYEDYIHDIVDLHFGWSHVYTPAEFKSTDLGNWPSWQELARRDKNLIIVVQRPGNPNPINSNLFFEVTEKKPNAPPLLECRDTNHDPNSCRDWDNNIVFFNTGDYTELPLSSQATGDYWASRMYPDRWCAPFGNGSAHETQGEWEDHIRTEATQVATNCLDTDWTNGRTSVSRKVHPPQPTFVVAAPTGSRQLGTLRYPYQGSGRGSFDSNVGYQDGLLGAISRVSDYGSSTEIWLTPGDYETYRWEFIEFRGITINKPMILKKNPNSTNGIVVIR